jgi:peroxiredoxin Q/BCP
LDQLGQSFSKNDLLGHWAVIYFYPRDFGTSCSEEAKEFTSFAERISVKETLLVGISPNGVQSHVNFFYKNEVKVTLLSDPDHGLMEAAGVWQKKKLYGKETFGVVRCTFLLDPKGIIREVWTKAKAKGHARAVLTRWRELR